MRINGQPVTFTGAMLRAAIYARKSTDDNDRNADNKSVTRQIERAKAYAASKGWMVANEHVYIDDAVSGATFGDNRPGLARLLASLPKRGKSPFGALIMSEASRLGRDARRNGYFLADILDSEVRVFYYLTDEEEKGDTPEQALMFNLRSYAAEVERLKAAQRSRDALARKAQHGYNAGGVTYGYDNVIVNGVNGAGEQVKSHTDYRINDQQAETIRRIFRMYVDGYGHTAIAKAMNRDSRYLAESRKYFSGRVPPTPRKGTGSWAPSSIRQMLYNERYTGKVPFGEFQKVYRKGERRRVRMGDPKLADRPDLRIVPEDLWNAAQKRLKAVRENYVRENNGTLWGRPENGRESKYLLSGLARCNLCGASMIGTKVALGSARKRKLVPHYECSYYANRGNSVCSNNWRKRMDELDDKVLALIERQVLTPSLVTKVIDRALRLAEERRRKEPDNTKKLEADIKQLERERDRLMAACAEGKVKPESLVAEISKREQGIETLKTELTRSPHRLAYELKEVEQLKAALVERIDKFREVMKNRRNVLLARQVLRKLLAEPIRCIPIMHDGRKDYAIRGRTRLGALLSSASVTVASPRGFEPRLPP